MPHVFFMLVSRVLTFRAISHHIGGDGGVTDTGSISHSSLAGAEVLYVDGQGRVIGGVTAHFGTGATGVGLLTGMGSALEVLGPLPLNASGLASSSHLVFENVLLQAALSYTGCAGLRLDLPETLSLGPAEGESWRLAQPERNPNVSRCWLRS